LDLNSFRSSTCRLIGADRGSSSSSRSSCQDEEDEEDEEEEEEVAFVFGGFDFAVALAAVPAVAFAVVPTTDPLLRSVPASAAAPL